VSDTYYLKFLDSVADSTRYPVSIFRRQRDESVFEDFVLGRDGSWRPTETVARWELGMDTDDIEQISEAEALDFIESVRDRIAPQHS